MTKIEFDRLRSNRQVACPECGGRKTEPLGGCSCPGNPSGYGTMHINRYHHVCVFGPNHEADMAQDRF